MTLKIVIAALLSLVAATLLASPSNHAAKAPPAPSGPPATPAEARFWAVVDASAKSAPNQRAQTAALRSALDGMTVSQIEEFDRVLAQKMRESYRWDLWGAAFLIQGGASDDGFEYFRRWLISRGRAFFEHAVAHPDDLADTIPDDAGDLEYEDFSYVAPELWAAKTGKDPAQMPMETSDASTGPAGSPIQEDEAWLAVRYPKLWKRFGSSPL